ncbi:MAG: hypothetical protein PHN22_05130 [Candidatus ainarchaeum sp.]|nr:hypothetical protein [Candidatus ainarchaeum sp.]
MKIEPDVPINANIVTIITEDESSPDGNFNCGIFTALSVTDNYLIDENGFYSPTGTPAGNYNDILSFCYEDDEDTLIVSMPAVYVANQIPSANLISLTLAENYVGTLIFESTAMVQPNPS